MVNQKVAEIASQAAAAHMGEMINSTINPRAEPEKSVYASVFEKLLTECNITQEEMEERIRKYGEDRLHEGMRAAQVGNMIKESKRPEMGHKIFKRLIMAVFPPR